VFSPGITASQLNSAARAAIASIPCGRNNAASQTSGHYRRRSAWAREARLVLRGFDRALAKAKRTLQEIWMAETKKDALAAFDAFAEAWGVKYDKAVECLIKDRDALLAFC